MRLSLALKYNPRWREQPRVPRGNPDGGQWTGGAQVAGAERILFPVLKEGGKRALRLAAPRVRRYLNRRPYYWEKGHDFPEEESSTKKRVGSAHSRHAVRSMRSTGSKVGANSGTFSVRPIPDGSGITLWNSVWKATCFAPERIHNTDNIVMLPLEDHRCISDTMSRKEKGMPSVMRFIVGQRPFWLQFNEGLDLVITCLEREGYDLDSFRW